MQKKVKKQKGTKQSKKKTIKKPPKKVVKLPVAKPQEVKVSPLSDVEVLLKAFDGDKELTLFFMAWIQCGRNAAKAYKKLHPDVTDGSAKVLGSRKLEQLTKVNFSVVLDGYGLGVDTYMKQLYDGVNATKFIEGVVIKNGEVSKASIEVPDHKTRDRYHTKIGKLLGIEKEEQTNVIQVNQNNNSIDNLKDDELDSIISR